MSRPLALVDVDGVVLDLMGGFARWAKQVIGLDVPIHTMRENNLAACTYFPPGTADIFYRFCEMPDVYRKWVPVLPGAVAGLTALHEYGFQVAFNTAILRTAPCSYESKFVALKDIVECPFEYLAVPSGMKHHVKADLAIDDRADICRAYENVGTRTILVARRWSFLPAEGLTLGTYPDPERVAWDAAEEIYLRDPLISDGFDWADTLHTDDAWQAIIDIVEDDSERN